jgi:hypothetical protein
LPNLNGISAISAFVQHTSTIIEVTIDPIFEKPITAIDANINASITTTIYDAQATNLNNGNVDEGITYSIKGTNANRLITALSVLPKIT